MGDQDLNEGCNELYDALKPCADAYEFNGPALRMLALVVAENGKPLGEVTLAEFAQLWHQAGERYNVMCDRLKNLIRVTDENNI